tara:strand:+ start:13 stop:291 length:279 start_codon:yes stop_codon:yes gene_type:complete
MKKNIKYFLIFGFIVIFLIFVSNFVFAFLQNKIVSILNSNKFENYIILKIDHYLEKVSDGELSEEQIDKYSIIFNKIYRKYKPVLDNLENNN